MKRTVYLAVVVRRDSGGNFLRDIELGPFASSKLAKQKAQDSARPQDDWAVDMHEQEWSDEDKMWLTQSAVTLEGTMIPELLAQ